MAKDVIARIILMFLLGLAIGGFIVLFLADRAKAEMTDQWGHQRYEAPRHKHVTKKRMRHTHKRHRRKRAPAVKAYVKRDIEDQVACKEMLTVIGDARPSRNTAQEDAEAVFMRATRFKYGEAWMSVENAQGYAIRCNRASITEIVGQTMVRCELRAKPCRPPFESK